ncbi:uncharacterized protein EV154DRAFT_504397 [Mucor mucedo]|uniref:uncharacterized protein n=1 Tax=Mucor mucedo TaxID=29922 RepID=UPI00221F3587|nr:uncharacterized protein EV154DRAFT_504397 [Mucor mucedo]KAI7892650.1 hypothetical protein EV154DRAFT_504397 [Mucor mucedo]
MDRLTQLQDAIDAMARMFTNSIYYVHEKSGMAELNKDIPVAQPKIQADEPHVFQENMRELASDLVKKAKEIDALIEVLPGIDQTEDEQIDLLRSLEQENQIANEEYEAAVKEMGKKKIY